MDSKKNPAEIVGQNIAAEMVQRGIAPEYLAVLLNVSEDTVIRWISGKRMITVYGLLRVSKIFGAPMERFTEGIE